MIQIYIESTNMLEYLKNTNFDENNIKNFISNIIHPCFHLGIGENKILIQNKEKIDRVYILIRGNCRHFKESKTLKQLTMKEYYLHLIRLHQKGEISTIKTNIEENKRTIKIEYSNIDRINHLLFLEELKYNLYKCRTKYNDLIKIFSDFFMNFKQFNIEQETLLEYHNSRNFELLSDYCKSKLKDEFENSEYAKDIERFKLKEENKEKYFFLICETIDLGYIPINTFISQEFLSEKFKDKEIIDFKKLISFNLSEEENLNNSVSPTKLDNRKLSFLEGSDKNKSTNNVKDKSFKRSSTLNIGNSNAGKLKSNKKISIVEQNQVLSKQNKNDENKKTSGNSPKQNNNEIEDKIAFSNLSIMCESKCDFLAIKISEFKDLINQEKQKIKTREIVFLTDNFFFSPVNKKVFEKRHFENFKLKTYSFDSVLFRENETPERLFLIKEGIIEISLNKNILELTNLIKDLIKYEPSLKNSIDNNSEFKANNQLKSIVDELSKKRKFSIFKYDSKDIIGMESMFLNKSYFYKATVISRKASIYEIDINLAKSLKKESQEIRNNFDNICLEKLNSFIKRVIYLKNIFIRNFDNRLTEEQTKIKLDVHNRKHVDKLAEINKNNGVNILSKEVISIDKYNQLKDMLLNKNTNEKNIIINNSPKNYNNNNIFNYRNVYQDTHPEEEKVVPLPKKIIVVNNLKSRNNHENSESIEDKFDKINNNKTKQDFSETSKFNQIEKIKDTAKNTLRKKTIHSQNSKINESKYTKEKNGNFAFNNISKETENNKFINNLDFHKKIKQSFLGNSKSNNESQIESKNISIGNIESKKRDFDIIFLGDKEKKRSKNDIIKVDNSDNNIDLMKYYNNYKSLRKISINFKMEEFFKEGIPLSTKAFENGSFFVTSNNSEDKIKWKKVDKKRKPKQLINRLKLEEIDPYMDKDILFANIMFTSPNHTNESVEYVNLRSPFKLKRIDLPIIKRIKYETEHKKNVENFILKKQKKLKLIDEKVLPIFKSVDNKKIKIDGFENPNFLGENNDYLLPKNSLKSEHIKEFYKMLHNKKMRGNKIRSHIFSNENSIIQN